MIRNCRISDLPRLAYIESLVFSVEYSPAKIVKLFFAHDIRVAIEDNNVVAYIVVTDEGYIHTLAVDPPYQGHGHGRNLLADLMDRILTGTELNLNVRTENHRAIKLYESFGFTKKHLIKDYYGPGSDGFNMTITKCSWYSRC